MCLLPAAIKQFVRNEKVHGRVINNRQVGNFSKKTFIHEINRMRIFDCKVKKIRLIKTFVKVNELKPSVVKMLNYAANLANGRYDTKFSTVNNKVFEGVSNLQSVDQSLDGDSYQSVNKVNDLTEKRNVPPHMGSLKDEKVNIIAPGCPPVEKLVSDWNKLQKNVADRTTAIVKCKMEEKSMMIENFDDCSVAFKPVLIKYNRFITHYDSRQTAKKLAVKKGACQIREGYLRSYTPKNVIKFDEVVNINDIIFKLRLESVPKDEEKEEKREYVDLEDNQRGPRCLTKDSGRTFRGDSLFMNMPNIKLVRSAFEHSDFVLKVEDLERNGKCVFVNGQGDYVKGKFAKKFIQFPIHVLGKRCPKKGYGKFTKGEDEKTHSCVSCLNERHTFIVTYNDEVFGPFRIFEQQLKRDQFRFPEPKPQAVVPFVDNFEMKPEFNYSDACKRLQEGEFKVNDVLPPSKYLRRVRRSVITMHGSTTNYKYHEVFVPSSVGCEQCGDKSIDAVYTYIDSGYGTKGFKTFVFNKIAGCPHETYPVSGTEIFKGFVTGTYIVVNGVKLAVSQLPSRDVQFSSKGYEIIETSGRGRRGRGSRGGAKAGPPTKRLTTIVEQTRNVKASDGANKEVKEQLFVSTTVTKLPKRLEQPEESLNKVRVKAITQSSLKGPINKAVTDAMKSIGKSDKMTPASTPNVSGTTTPTAGSGAGRGWTSLNQTRGRGRGSLGQYLRNVIGTIMINLFCLIFLSNLPSILAQNNTEFVGAQQHEIRTSLEIDGILYVESDLADKCSAILTPKDPLYRICINYNEGKYPLKHHRVTRSTETCEPCKVCTVQLQGKVHYYGYKISPAQLDDMKMFCTNVLTGMQVHDDVLCWCRVFMSGKYDGKAEVHKIEEFANLQRLNRAQWLEVFGNSHIKQHTVTVRGINNLQNWCWLLHNFNTMSIPCNSLDIVQSENCANIINKALCVDGRPKEDRLRGMRLRDNVVANLDAEVSKFDSRQTSKATRPQTLGNVSQSCLSNVSNCISNRFEKLIAENDQAVFKKIYEDQALTLQYRRKTSLRASGCPSPNDSCKYKRWLHFEHATSVTVCDIKCGDVYVIPVPEKAEMSQPCKQKYFECNIVKSELVQTGKVTGVSFMYGDIYTTVVMQTDMFNDMSTVSCIDFYNKTVMCSVFNIDGDDNSNVGLVDMPPSGLFVTNTLSRTMRVHNAFPAKRIGKSWKMVSLLRQGSLTFSVRSDVLTWRSQQVIFDVTTEKWQCATRDICSTTGINALDSELDFPPKVYVSEQAINAKVMALQSKLGTAMSEVSHTIDKLIDDPVTILFGDGSTDELRGLFDTIKKAITGFGIIDVILLFCGLVFFIVKPPIGAAFVFAWMAYRISGAAALEISDTCGSMDTVSTLTDNKAFWSIEEVDLVEDRCYRFDVQKSKDKIASLHLLINKFDIYLQTQSPIYFPVKYSFDRFHSWVCPASGGSVCTNSRCAFGNDYTFTTKCATVHSTGVWDYGCGFVGTVQVCDVFRLDAIARINVIECYELIKTENIKIFYEFASITPEGADHGNGTISPGEQKTLGDFTISLPAQAVEYLLNTKYICMDNFNDKVYGVEQQMKRDGMIWSIDVGVSPGYGRANIPKHFIQISSLKPDEVGWNYMTNNEEIWRLNNFAYDIQRAGRMTVDYDENGFKTIAYHPRHMDMRYTVKTEAPEIITWKKMCKFTECSVLDVSKADIVLSKQVYSVHIGCMGTMGDDLYASIHLSGCEVVGSDAIANPLKAPSFNATAHTILKAPLSNNTNVKKYDYDHIFKIACAIGFQQIEYSVCAATGTFNVTNPWYNVYQLYTISRNWMNNIMDVDKYEWVREARLFLKNMDIWSWLVGYWRKAIIIVFALLVGWFVRDESKWLAIAIIVGGISFAVAFAAEIENPYANEFPEITDQEVEFHVNPVIEEIQDGWYNADGYIEKVSSLYDNIKYIILKLIYSSFVSFLSTLLNVSILFSFLFIYVPAYTTNMFFVYLICLFIILAIMYGKLPSMFVFGFFSYPFLNLRISHLRYLSIHNRKEFAYKCLFWFVLFMCMKATGARDQCIYNHACDNCGPGEKLLLLTNRNWTLQGRWMNEKPCTETLGVMSYAEFEERFVGTFVQEHTVSYRKVDLKNAYCCHEQYHEYLSQGANCGMDYKEWYTKMAECIRKFDYSSVVPMKCTYCASTNINLPWQSTDNTTWNDFKGCEKLSTVSFQGSCDKKIDYVEYVSKVLKSWFKKGIMIVLVFMKAYRGDAVTFLEVVQFIINFGDIVFPTVLAGDGLEPDFDFTFIAWISIMSFKKICKNWTRRTAPKTYDRKMVICVSRSKLFETISKLTGCQSNKRIWKFVKVAMKGYSYTKHSRRLFGVAFSALPLELEDLKRCEVPTNDLEKARQWVNSCNGRKYRKYILEGEDVCKTTARFRFGDYIGGNVNEYITPEQIRNFSIEEARSIEYRLPSPLDNNPGIYRYYINVENSFFERIKAVLGITTRETADLTKVGNIVRIQNFFGVKYGFIYEDEVTGDATLCTVAHGGGDRPILTKHLEIVDSHTIKASADMKTIFPTKIDQERDIAYYGRPFCFDKAEVGGMYIVWIPHGLNYGGGLGAFALMKMIDLQSGVVTTDDLGFTVMFRTGWKFYDPVGQTYYNPYMKQCQGLSGLPILDMNMRCVGILSTYHRFGRGTVYVDRTRARVTKTSDRIDCVAKEISIHPPGVIKFVVMPTGTGKSTELPYKLYTSHPRMAGIAPKVLVLNPLINAVEQLQRYMQKAKDMPDVYKASSMGTTEKGNATGITYMTYGHANVKESFGIFLKTWDYVIFDEYHQMDQQILLSILKLNDYLLTIEDDPVEMKASPKLVFATATDLFSTNQTDVNTNPRITYNKLLVDPNQENTPIHPKTISKETVIVYLYGLPFDTNNLEDGHKYLIFVPSQDMCKTLAAWANERFPTADCYAYYSGCGLDPITFQDKVKATNKMVLVFATNYIESGVTLDFDVVYDTRMKIMPMVVWNEEARRFERRLERVRITPQECVQRAGRVGRMKPGVYNYCVDPGHNTPHIKLEDLFNALVVFRFTRRVYESSLKYIPDWLQDQVNYEYVIMFDTLLQLIPTNMVEACRESVDRCNKKDLDTQMPLWMKILNVGYSCADASMVGVYAPVPSKYLRTTSGGVIAYDNRFKAWSQNNTKYLTKMQDAMKRMNLFDDFAILQNPEKRTNFETQFEYMQILRASLDRYVLQAGVTDEGYRVTCKLLYGVERHDMEGVKYTFDNTAARVSNAVESKVNTITTTGPFEVGFCAGFAIGGLAGYKWLKQNACGIIEEVWSLEDSINITAKSCWDWRRDGTGMLSFHGPEVVPIADMIRVDRVGNDGKKYTVDVSLPHPEDPIRQFDADTIDKDLRVEDGYTNLSPAEIESAARLVEANTQIAQDIQEGKLMAKEVAMIQSDVEAFTEELAEINVKMAEALKDDNHDVFAELQEQEVELNSTVEELKMKQIEVSSSDKYKKYIQHKEALKIVKPRSDTSEISEPKFVKTRPFNKVVEGETKVTAAPNKLEEIIERFKEIDWQQLSDDTQRRLIGYWSKSKSWVDEVIEWIENSTGESVVDLLEQCGQVGATWFTFAFYEKIRRTFGAFPAILLVIAVSGWAFVSFGVWKNILMLIGGQAIYMGLNRNSMSKLHGGEMFIVSHLTNFCMWVYQMYTIGNAPVVDTVINQILEKGPSVIQKVANSAITESVVKPTGLALLSSTLAHSFTGVTSTSVLGVAMNVHQIISSLMTTQVDETTINHGMSLLVTAVCGSPLIVLRGFLVGTIVSVIQCVLVSNEDKFRNIMKMAIKGSFADRDIFTEFTDKATISNVIQSIMVALVYVLDPMQILQAVISTLSGWVRNENEIKIDHIARIAKEHAGLSLVIWLLIEARKWMRWMQDDYAKDIQIRTVTTAKVSRSVNLIKDAGKDLLSLIMLPFHILKDWCYDLWTNSHYKFMRMSLKKIFDQKKANIKTWIHMHGEQFKETAYQKILKWIKVNDGSCTYANDYRAISGDINCYVGQTNAMLADVDILRVFGVCSCTSKFELTYTRDIAGRYIQGEEKSVCDGILMKPTYENVQGMLTDVRNDSMLIFTCYGKYMAQSLISFKKYDFTTQGVKQALKLNMMMTELPQHTTRNWEEKGAVDSIRLLADQMYFEKHKQYANTTHFKVAFKCNQCEIKNTHKVIFEFHGQTMVNWTITSWGCGSYGNSASEFAVLDSTHYNMLNFSVMDCRGYVQWCYLSMFEPGSLKFMSSTEKLKTADFDGDLHVVFTLRGVTDVNLITDGETLIEGIASTSSDNWEENYATILTNMALLPHESCAGSVIQKWRNDMFYDVKLNLPFTGFLDTVKSNEFKIPVPYVADLAHDSTKEEGRLRYIVKMPGMRAKEILQSDWNDIELDSGSSTEIKMSLESMLPIVHIFTTYAETERFEPVRKYIRKRYKDFESVIVPKYKDHHMGQYNIDKIMHNFMIQPETSFWKMLTDCNVPMANLRSGIKAKVEQLKKLEFSQCAEVCWDKVCKCWKYTCEAGSKVWYCFKGAYSYDIIGEDNEDDVIFDVKDMNLSYVKGHLRMDSAIMDEDSDEEAETQFDAWVKPVERLGLYDVTLYRSKFEKQGYEDSVLSRRMWSRCFCMPEPYQGGHELITEAVVSRLAWHIIGYKGIRLDHKNFVVRLNDPNFTYVDPEEFTKIVSRHQPDRLYAIREFKVNKDEFPRTLDHYSRMFQACGYDRYVALYEDVNMQHEWMGVDKSWFEPQLADPEIFDDEEHYVRWRTVWLAESEGLEVEKLPIDEDNLKSLSSVESLYQKEEETQIVSIEPTEPTYIEEEEHRLSSLEDLIVEDENKQPENIYYGKVSTTVSKLMDDDLMRRNVEANDAVGVHPFRIPNKPLLSDVKRNIDFDLEVKCEKKLRVVPIKGEGNCLFRAFSYMVFGTQVQYRRIKDFIRRNVLDDSDLSDDDNVRRFSMVLLTDGLHGDEEHIAAFAYCMGWNVCFHQPGTVELIKVPEATRTVHLRWTEYVPACFDKGKESYRDGHFEVLEDVNDKCDPSIPLEKMRAMKYAPLWLPRSRNKVDQYGRRDYYAEAKTNVDPLYKTDQDEIEEFNDDDYENYTCATSKSFSLMSSLKAALFGPSHNKTRVLMPKNFKEGKTYKVASIDRGADIKLIEGIKFKGIPEYSMTPYMREIDNIEATDCDPKKLKECCEEVDKVIYSTRRMGNKLWYQLCRSGKHFRPDAGEWVSRGAFKFHEMDEIYHIQNWGSKSLWIAEGRGGFMQMYMRKLALTSHAKTAKVWITTSATNKRERPHITSFDIPKQVRYSVITCMNEADNNILGENDIRNNFVRRYIQNEISDMVDFISCDGGESSFNMYEAGKDMHEYIISVLDMCYLSLRIGGNLIMKTNDMFYNTKEWCLLLSHFKHFSVFRSPSQVNCSQELYFILYGFNRHKVEYTALKNVEPDLFSEVFQNYKLDQINKLSGAVHPIYYFHARNNVVFRYYIPGSLMVRSMSWLIETGKMFARLMHYEYSNMILRKQVLRQLNYPEVLSKDKCQLITPTYNVKDVKRPGMWSVTRDADGNQIKLDKYEHQSSDSFFRSKYRTYGCFWAKINGVVYKDVQEELYHNFCNAIGKPMSSEQYPDTQCLMWYGKVRVSEKYGTNKFQVMSITGTLVKKLIEGPIDWLPVGMASKTRESWIEAIQKKINVRHRPCSEHDVNALLEATSKISYYNHEPWGLTSWDEIMDMIKPKASCGWLEDASLKELAENPEVRERVDRKVRMMMEGTIPTIVHSANHKREVRAGVEEPFPKPRIIQFMDGESRLACLRLIGKIQTEHTLSKKMYWGSNTGRSLTHVGDYLHSEWLKYEQPCAIMMDVKAWDTNVTCEELCVLCESFKPHFQKALHKGIETYFKIILSPIIVDLEGNSFGRCGQVSSGEVTTSRGNGELNIGRTVQMVHEATGMTIEWIMEHVTICCEGDDLVMILEKRFADMVLAYATKFLERVNKPPKLVDEHGRIKFTYRFEQIEFCSHTYKPVPLGDEVHYLPHRPLTELLGKFALTKRIVGTSMGSPLSRELNRSKAISYLLLYPAQPVIRRLCLLTLCRTGWGTFDTQEFEYMFGNISGSVSLMSAVKSVYPMINNLEDIGYFPRYVIVKDWDEVQARRTTYMKQGQAMYNCVAHMISECVNVTTHLGSITKISLRQEYGFDGIVDFSFLILDRFLLKLFVKDFRVKMFIKHLSPDNILEKAPKGLFPAPEMVTYRDIQKLKEINGEGIQFLIERFKIIFGDARGHLNRFDIDFVVKKVGVEDRSSKFGKGIPLELFDRKILVFAKDIMDFQSRYVYATKEVVKHKDFTLYRLINRGLLFLGAKLSVTYNI